MFNILYEFVIGLLSMIKPFLPSFEGVDAQFFFLHGDVFTYLEIPFLMSVISAIVAIEITFRTFKLVVFIIKIIRG